MRENGFTLAEILVAGFMAALISVMGANLVAGTMAAHRNVETRTQHVLDMQAGLALMRTDLEQISTSRQAKQPDGTLAPIFAGNGIESEKPLVALVRSGRGWPPLQGQELGTDLSYVEYVLYDGNLTRMAREPVDAAFNTNMSERIVLQGISNASIEYLGQKGWEHKWQERGFPRAVVLSFDMPEFTGMRCLFLVGNGSGKLPDV